MMLLSVKRKVQWNKARMPFIWQRLDGGYGYNVDTIAIDGNIVIKDIYGQIMVDEYPPM